MYLITLSPNESGFKVVGHREQNKSYKLFSDVLRSLFPTAAQRNFILLCKQYIQVGGWRLGLWSYKNQRGVGTIDQSLFFLCFCHFCPCFYQDRLVFHFAEVGGLDVHRDTDEGAPKRIFGSGSHHLVLDLRCVG